MSILLRKFRKTWANSLVFFLLCQTYFSCEKCPIVKEEKELVTGFFEELLLEHGGAFTLFGLKPMTMDPLLNLSAEALEEMRTYLNAHPEIESVDVTRRFEEGWEIWKKERQPSRFALREFTIDGTQMVVFANLAKVLDALQEYHKDFRQIFGADFDPYQVLRDLKNGRGTFWPKVLLDHKARGILLGYGYKNASLFLQQKAKGLATSPSENNDPRLPAECTLNKKPFRIPLFAVLDEAESQTLIAKYKEERDQIKALYQKKDFLQFTLGQIYAR